MKISIKDIKIETTSGLDDTGCLFRWKEGVYRGIYKDYSDFFRQIFPSPLGDDLVRIGVISTEVSSFELDGFGLVLKHYTIPVISYAPEWSIAMLRDAALLVCDIQIRLLQSGYTLKDPHPWNVLFDGCTPRYVDIGSITKKDPAALQCFLTELCYGFLYPLLLKRAGLSAAVNATMMIHLGLPELPIMRTLLMVMPLHEWFFHYRKKRKVNRIWNRSPQTGVKHLREQIEAISDGFVMTEWSHYASNDESFETNPDISAKVCAVEELLDKVRPKSVLDIGVNIGLYSKLAASKGARVIAADIDEFVINELYYRGKAENLNILPVCLDICTSMGKHGPWNIYRSSQERFGSEMVIMLALVHHLVQKRGGTFDQIAQSLSAFTQKLALVEFVGSKDKHVCTWDRIQNPSYNLDNFKKALSQYFPGVEVYRQVNDDRWLILCTRQ